MASKQQAEERSPQNDQALQRQSAEIGKHVMHALGQPHNLYAVQVRPLWEHRFRVNVYVGADLVNARVAHSYFLQVNGEGNVVASTPAITKQY